MKNNANHAPVLLPRSLKLLAKPKVPLAACGPEKLRATLKATQLECKELKRRLQHLERNIE
jgi:hypothetical protein